MPEERATELIIERLTNRVDEANTLFLKEMGAVIKKIKELTPSEAHKLVQMLKYGDNYDKIVKQISKYTDLNVRDIDEIFANYAKKDLNFSQNFYRYRNIPFTPYEQNTAIKMQTEALAQVVKNQVYNFSRSNVLGYSVKDDQGNLLFEGLKQTYNDLLDTALMNVSQGKETFDSSMSRIMQSIGESGLKTLDFESGRSIRLDSAIRMHLRGKLRELQNENQKLIGDQIDFDGWEISVHENPALDHQDAQGHQFRIDEYEKLQTIGVAKDYKGKEINLHLDRKTTQSTAVSFRPISEYNCYHIATAIVLGVSEPRYTDKQLQEIINRNNKGFDFEGKHYTMYEGSQLQRQIETEIRKQKDLQIFAKSADNQELIAKSQGKITKLLNKYDELNKASGLKPKLNRLRVEGYRKVKIEEPKKLIENKIFINKDKQIKRLNYRETYLKEKMIEAQNNLNKIPTDSNRMWDITMRKDLQKKINSYDKEIKEINSKNVIDKTITLNNQEDCKSLLKELNIELKDTNLDRVDNEVIISTSKKYYETIEKYPFLEKNLQENGFSLEFGDLPGGVIGQAQRGGRKVELDIGSLGKKDDAIFWGEYQTKDNYNMPCSKDNYMVYHATHELGHLFNYRVLDNIDIKGYEDLSAREYTQKTNEYFIDKIFNIASSESGKTKAELTSLMSDYGKKDVDEAMAELFANANCGKPNALGDAFNKYFEELLK